MLFYDTWAKPDINARAAPFPLVARKGWGGGGVQKTCSKMIEPSGKMLQILLQYYVIILQIFF